MRYGKAQHKAILMTLLLAVAVIAVPALAEQDIDRSADFSATGSIMIKNLAGSVVVVGWDKNEIQVVGTLDDQVKEFEFDVKKNKARIETIYPRRVKNIRHGSDLEIHVPHGCKVEIGTVSAEIEISDVDGALYPSTVSGEIFITGEPVEIEAESVSGEIELTVKTDKVRVESVSGELVLNGVEGEVIAETVSGEINIEGGVFQDLDCETVSGEIIFTGQLDSRGSFSFSSHSGDVILNLEQPLDAEFEVNTFSGDIDNDFGPDGRRTSKRGPGRELEFTVGDGEARVRIDTFSGDVELREE